MYLIEDFPLHFTLNAYPGDCFLCLYKYMCLLLMRMQYIAYVLSFYQFIAFSFTGELGSLFNGVSFFLLSMPFIYACLLCYFSVFLVVVLHLYVSLFLCLFSLFCLFFISILCYWLFKCLCLYSVSA